MRIGQLPHWITLERPVATKDAYGDEDVTWERIGDCWAFCISDRGEEINERGRLQGKHTWTVKVRYRDDVTTKDRILHGNKTLYISSISHDSSRSDLTEYLCTEYQE